jgi:hypothetical protein
LIDDNEEDDGKKRIWCTITYSVRFQVFNTVINILHFFTPFVINIISAAIIIIMTTKQRTVVQVNQMYRTVLSEQFKKHNHLLIASFVLVILAVRRLIISCVSGCMKSTDDSWLFLIGYLISLIPPTLTFVIFVIPSKLYKEVFWKTIKRYQKLIQTRLHMVLRRLVKREEAFSSSFLLVNKSFQKGHKI